MDPTALVQPHAEAIVAALTRTLRAPDPHAKLEAAKLLLDWAWGPPDRKGAGASGGLSAARQQAMVAWLLSQPGPPPGPDDLKSANPSATSCPARHKADEPQSSPAFNPMPLEGDAPAAAAAPEPPPSSPDAAPDADSRRGDADPMSRPVLPARHSADDPFRRRLPPPPPMEPPWPFADSYGAGPRKRWPPWR